MATWIRTTWGWARKGVTAIGSALGYGSGPYGSGGYGE